MRREVFVAGTREEAIRLAQPYLEVKYKTYREWGQDKVMPAGDDFDHGFDELLDDRFLIGAPAEVAERLIDLHALRGQPSRRSLHWPGMPSLALEQMQISPRSTPFAAGLEGPHGDGEAQRTVIASPPRGEHRRAIQR